MRMKTHRGKIDAVYFAGSVIAAIMAVVAPATGQPYDVPASVDSSQIPGLQAEGTNYSITSPVVSDGFLRIYNVETPYGAYRIEGDAFLRMRLRELAAIDALAQIEETDRFQKSFQEALKGPIDFAGDLVTQPGETIERTVTGVGRLFGRVASGVRNAGKSPDNAAEALLGVSKAKREIAVELGVDPYTDFMPLGDRLDRAAQATAFGGLTVKGLFALVPGGAGVAVSSVSTATDVADMVRQRTAAELRDINRSQLVRAVGQKRSIDIFLDNRNYTPTDQTVIASALQNFAEVRNVDAFLVRAAGVGQRSQAVFMRERARALAHHHREVEPFEAFVTVAEVPFALSASGDLIGVFPIDDLAWTEGAAALVTRISDEVSADSSAGNVKLYITGKASPATKDELQRLGWSLEENIALPVQ